jgi:hypothetical protein
MIHYASHSVDVHLIPLMSTYCRLLLLRPKTFTKSIASLDTFLGSSGRRFKTFKGFNLARQDMQGYWAQSGYPGTSIVYGNVISRLKGWLDKYYHAKGVITHRLPVPICFDSSEVENSTESASPATMESMEAKSSSSSSLSRRSIFRFFL